MIVQQVYGNDADVVQKNLDTGLQSTTLYSNSEGIIRHLSTGLSRLVSFQGNDMASNTPPVQPVNIGEVIEYLLGQIPQDEQLTAFLSWPPDVFAVVGYLLRESGAYVEVVKPWSGRNPPTAEQWSRRVSRDSSGWIIAAAKKGTTRLVRKLWAKIISEKACLLTEIQIRADIWQTLLRLLATADAACAGFGVETDRVPHRAPAVVSAAESAVAAPSKMDAAVSNLLWRASLRFWTASECNAPTSCTEQGRCKEFSACHDASTLCERVDPSKVVVLPKMHTPQSGITIRSLTHHLALVGGSHVIPKWINFHTERKHAHALNLLLVPWPFEVFPSQFEPIDLAKSSFRMMAEQHSFFRYRPRQVPDDFKENIKKLCHAAAARVGKVDGIILPEMALAPVEYEQLRDWVAADTGFLVCGVYDPANGGGPARNYVEICLYDPAMEDKYIEHRQQKHHRWFLDRSQIAQYGLGSALDPAKKWWEYTTLESRTIHFVTLDKLLTMAVLICEDLARPDPVGEILRAVGPNLVVAILQDGPQLASRWASRYATVLADDPGSAVLSLTSAGMCQLSRSRDGLPAKRVIALWRDKDTGTREIELPADAHGALLSLTIGTETEWTADGRDDAGLSGCLRLSGVHMLRW